jgi:hypothetical protein
MHCFINQRCHAVFQGLCTYSTKHIVKRKPVIFHRAYSFYDPTNASLDVLHQITKVIIHIINATLKKTVRHVNTGTVRVPVLMP